MQRRVLVAMGISVALAATVTARPVAAREHTTKTAQVQRQHHRSHERRAQRQRHHRHYAARGRRVHSDFGGRDGRPAAWCGWEMRRLVGADPGPSYNLARNWAHWGTPGPAGIGAVVVWPHHVGKIVGQQNGQWVVESGNDGHALRSRPRSIAGAIAIRWG